MKLIRHTIAILFFVTSSSFAGDASNRIKSIFDGPDKFFQWDFEVTSNLDYASASVATNISHPSVVRAAFVARCTDSKLLFDKELPQITFTLNYKLKGGKFVDHLAKPGEDEDYVLDLFEPRSTIRIVMGDYSFDGSTLSEDYFSRSRAIQDFYHELSQTKANDITIFFKDDRVKSANLKARFPMFDKDETLRSLHKLCPINK